MTQRLIGLLTLLLAVLDAGAALAAETRDLLMAARSGDLAGVKRFIKEGVPVDAADDWGTTPLYLAVQQGQIEVVRFLLEKGADPSGRETFFNTNILDVSLWEGEPDYAVTKALLAAGAKNRANALGHALETGNVALARAAVESGPVLESEAAELRRRYGELEGEIAEVFAGMKTEKDPPPPTYTATELADFAGHFAGSGKEATVALQDGALVLDMDGTKPVLAAMAERMFRNEETGVVVRYYGRAGNVEGIFVYGAETDPVRMRLADDSPVAAVADLPEFVVDPNAKPTVNWPGFRGENRSGIGDGLDTPVDFDVDTGKGVAWSVEVPGLANSSPVVWGDRVYITTAVAEGGSTPLRTGLTGAGDEVEEAVEHRWLVLAYDKATGNKVWESEVGRGVPLTKRHFKATQANSSPATDGEHIVVVFPTAGLACLGKNGSLHWKHDLGGLNAGGFNDPGLQWGFAASPIIHKGKVILQVDIHDGPYLAAWDLKTGKELWRTERPDVAPSWSTPAIWPTPKGEELVVNASVIRGYDPETGRELWRLGPTSIQVVASPVIGKTNLFVSSGYPPARPIYAVKPGIRGEHAIESDDDAGPLAWYQTRGGAYMPTPLLYRGLLYIVHHNARLVAHDARNGQPVLKARFSAGGTMTSSPVAANGRIYQGSEEGTLYVIEAGPTYKELAVHEFGEPLMATPAISEGLLLVRTPSKLIALGDMEARRAAANARSR
jgi:outer membrane protein assembly factor BamB